MKKLYSFIFVFIFAYFQLSSQDVYTFNKWFKKTTGSNYVFNSSQVKFDTKNYESAIIKFPNMNYNLEDVTGENLALTKPSVISNIGYNKITFKEGWTITILSNPNFYIRSIHHGSSGEAQVFNLKTGVLEDVDFEIFELNGDIALIHTSWHDGGRYVSKNGYYDLNTKKVKYGNAKRY